MKDFDSIISHLYPMNWLAFLAKKIYKITYIYWYHGIPDPETYPNLYEKAYLRMFIFLTKLTVQNVDKAFSISKFAQNEFKKYTGLDSKIMYCTIDTKKFRKDLDGSPLISLKYFLNISLIAYNIILGR